MRKDHIQTDRGSEEEKHDLAGRMPTITRKLSLAQGFFHRSSGRKMLALWLVALVGLLGMTGPNGATATIVKRAFLPEVIGTPKAFQWAWVGLTLSGTDSLDRAPVDGLARWHSLAWNETCADPFDTTPSKIGLQRRIPMVFGHQHFNDVAKMNALFNGPCNDGRPLFFLNEPENADESNVPPATAADMFYTMTQGTWPRQRWKGPIYATGAIIDHHDWVDQFIDSYANRYNHGSRAIPQIAGWELHLYANWGGFGGDPPLSALTDAAFQTAISHEREQIQSFINQRLAEGNSTKIYFNETGLLKHLSANTSDGTPAQYAERMAVLLRYQDAMLREFRPNVEGYQWFSVYASDPYCTNCAWLTYSGTNLVFPDGTLTATGKVWRELAAKEQ